ncbi:MAG: hypothetical protein CYPHOPRED_004560 [Cyphobasidiales sp. Tagirdzhanova-0007]|nr:MAG: hypothetical protein CYPHOPRED_004560 [Cyphobasidiales sp. Tagirdzhanova-0007]
MAATPAVGALQAGTRFYAGIFGHSSPVTIRAETYFTSSVPHRLCGSPLHSFKKKTNIQHYSPAEPSAEGDTDKCVLLGGPVSDGRYNDRRKALRAKRIKILLLLLIAMMVIIGGIVGGVFSTKHKISVANVTGATTPVNGGITVGNPTHDGQSSQGPDPGTDSSSCYPTEGGASTNPGCPDDPNGNFWNPGGGPDGSGNLNEVGDSNGDDENDSGDDEEEEGDDDDDNSDDKR